MPWFRPGAAPNAAAPGVSSAIPLLCVTGFVLVTGVCLAPPVHARVIERGSVDSLGNEGNALSSFASLSSDGRHVAFLSHASNLVSGDTNDRVDIFVRDRETGQVTRVSVDSSGNQANGNNNYPSISADGRYVAFEARGSNLVSGDTNNTYDILVHDRDTGQTTRVSLDSAGNPSNGISSLPSLSGDGRHVAFESIASNLVSGDSNGAWDIFVHDRDMGQTTRVSVDGSGAQANGSSYRSRISANGRHVVFASDADNLVADDTNGRRDIFVHDRDTGQTTRVSLDSDGHQANHDSDFPAISGDGRHVVFESYASNLVADDSNGAWDVFVHDRDTGQTTRVSLDSTGGQANGNSAYPVISGDGRYVAFHSVASNLVAGDSNGVQDVFVHDRSTGQTRRVSVDALGVAANGSSGLAAISADGGHVAFESLATHLVAADGNGVRDVFLAENLLASTQSHAVVITLDPPAGGTAACAPDPVSHGGSSGCTASPAPGYVFDGWSGDCTGMGCTLDFVVSGRSVTAHFTPQADPVPGMMAVPGPGMGAWGMLSALMGMAGGFAAWRRKGGDSPARHRG